MPGDYTDRFVEVLNSTFKACDENGTGFVETNRLIDFLISQEPSWLDNETIREEFHKVLQGDLNYISKEDFIKCLLGWFEASLNQDNDTETEKNIVSEAGKCSSSTSGVGESSELASGSSTNSMEEIYSGTNFVTDEQTFTNEDLSEEASLNDSGSSQAEERLIKVLQSEISTLLRKNDYLESLNHSLLVQVSNLEDTLVKKKEESEDYKKQLIKSSNRLELLTQKIEETEDRINLATEENKSVAIYMSQFKKENTKLKSLVSHLEQKLESSLSENLYKTTKLEEITNKFNSLNDLHNNSIKLLAQERENFRFKETEQENAWSEIIAENKNLQFQLDSNTSYTEHIKCKLKAALKELSDIQSARIKNVMEADNSGADNSMVLFDEDFSLDRTIPFETSLLAELKEEVEIDKTDCCCVCKQNVSLTSTPSNVVDVAVGTCTVETMDKATITFHKLEKCDFCSKVEHKDVGVECSFKVISLKKKILSTIGFCQRTRNDLM